MNTSMNVHLALAGDSGGMIEINPRHIGGKTLTIDFKISTGWYGDHLPNTHEMTVFVNLEQLRASKDALLAGAAKVDLVLKALEEKEKADGSQNEAGTDDGDTAGAGWDGGDRGDRPVVPGSEPAGTD